MADRVHVMYAGRLVEVGGTEPLFQEPLHPYTSALLLSVPRIDGDPNQRLATIPGQPPDLAAGFSGCAFAARCGYVDDQCRSQAPALTSATTDSGARLAACHYMESIRSGDRQENSQ